MSCNFPPKPGFRRFIPPFIGFTEFTPTIPKMYWDVHSQEQRIHRICELLDKLICYADFLGEKTDINISEIEALKAEFEEFKEHGFDDYYLEQIEKWINENIETVLHLLIRQVFFGLTIDGYFVAYIPESWNDIVFDTGANYALDTYGRLILRWDADSPYSVEQTPEIVRPIDEDYLREQIVNIMNTLYSTEGLNNG